MKRTLFTFLILLLSLVEVYAQKQTECFQDFQEFLADSASILIEDKLTQKTTGELILMGGTKNYSFKNVQDKSLRKKLIKEVWAVRQDGKTFINSFPYSKFKGYNEILGIGQYSYFIGPAPTSLDKKNQLKLGFIKQGKPAIYMTSTSAPYVLLPDGEIKYLNKELLGQLVDGYDELETEIKSVDQGDYERMFAILDKLNEIKN